MAETAVAYAIRTVNRRTADLRHFFSAFLADESAAIDLIAALGWRPTSAAVQELRQELYERIATTPEEAEAMSAWRQILKITEKITEENPSSPIEPHPYEISGFASDQVETQIDVGDPLDLMSEVKAFANLICLEEAEPPLSIGLFGGWGSGKSTFMQLLENEIELLAGRVRRAGSKTVARNLFVRNVVQVRFNAWHFADANLWASLTAEFFDQLRAGGYARSGKAIHTQLVEKVNAHVHALASEATNSRRALLESEDDLREAQKTRDRLVADIESDPNRMLRQTIIDEVTKSYEKHKTDLYELGRKANLDNSAKDISDFLEISKEIRSMYGQIRLIVNYISARFANVAYCGWNHGDYRRHVVDDLQ